LFNQQYRLAGVVGFFSLFVRQNNIVWLGFMCAFICYEKYNVKFDLQTLKHYIKDCLAFIIGFAIFTVFIIVNKGIAVGDKGMHPAYSLHLGNIFFMLFLFFFLFFPLNISNFSKITRFLKGNKNIGLLIMVVFLVYQFTFSNTHPFNQEKYNFFLRNKILIYFSSTTLLKILFFIPVAYSLLSIKVTELSKKPFYLIYPFTILYLIPSWLIEQRYYLIPFTLFMLFKKEQTKLVTYSTITIYVLSSAILFYGIRMKRFFL